MKFTSRQALAGAGLVVCSLVVAMWVELRGAPVEVALVTQGPMRQTVVTSGRVATVARTELASQSTARIERITVQEGDRVQAGQILVQLRDDEAQAALRQADASVGEARMRIRQIQTIQSPVSDQQLQQARANHQQAQEELARTQDLMRQGFVSQSRLDEVLRIAHTSHAALLSATAQAQGNRADGAEQALAHARLEQALAARAAAASRLDQLSLRAPANATVIARAADPGDTAQPGHALLTLAGGGDTRIHASVDEKNLRFLRLNQLARATADAYAERPFTARLTYIAPAVDAQRGTVELRLQVEPPVDDLRTDMTVSVEIVTAQEPDAVMLASDALQRLAAGELFVWLNQEGRARKTSVKAGLQGSGTTQIVQGLAAGDRVILPGARLKEGDRVRETYVRTPNAPAQAMSGLDR